MTRPLLLFDGDCGFCRMWVERFRQRTGEHVEYVAYQEAAARFPDIPRENLAHAIHLIEPDGHRSRAAEAAYRTLTYGDCRWLMWCYRIIPGFKACSEAAYRQIARHRSFFSRLTRFFWGGSPDLPTYTVSHRLVLKGLAVIYLLAFASLGTQILGLIGSQGILPARQLLMHASGYGAKAYWLLPTLTWFNSGNTMLEVLCWGGVALATLALFDLLPTLVFALLWMFYLSLVNVGGDFLSFQWDALLLETGLIAILMTRSSKTGLFLLRWLLFRLMVQSACVKWASGDPLWHHLRALDVHFETQPLPNVGGWLAHQLPQAVHTVMCGAVFVIEGIVPFFMVAPRRLRLTAFGLLVGLQGIISLTGNYGFFNLLTIVLCSTLVDDATWKTYISSARQFVSRAPAVLNGAIGPGLQPAGATTMTASKVVIHGVAIFLFVVSLVLWGAEAGLPIPRPLIALVQLEYPLRSVNNYGLFAVMTPERNEIEIEGSTDGKEWKSYGFKYKPQALDRHPLQVAPFQPRLDWQMWFAALGDYRQNPWFVQLCAHLLMGSPDVLRLLKTNPFPGTPPRYIRASLYTYRFTTFAEHRKTGTWWTRAYRGTYLPAISLRGN